ncbi:MAG TPA: DNA-formamidopyrimidine glycosylase family protein, partial [Candidatus Doudnabacteria bacterium]|nr:DNA-formamidopyrimidine glycosylase family protein [Candidatus Doudnabacteria bacterium]
MPELPEVETVVSELNKKLRGRQIKRVAVHAAKVISVGPNTVSNLRDVSQKTVNQFVKLLTGRKIVSVSRRGKMLIFDVDGPLAMLVHLKMTGQFIFEDKALAKKTGSQYRLLNKTSAPLVKLPSKHTHVVFYFTDGSTLYFNDIRKFGYLRVVLDKDIQHVKEFREYGPEPLEKSFTFEVFRD